MTDAKRLTLAHGSGGEPMQQLLHQHIQPLFDNAILARQEDQARLNMTLAPGERLAFTTDSFVVTPLCFPGGNIGTLAANGTLNDLVVGGARPHYLSCALIIEEGLPLETLQALLADLAREVRAAGALVVTGDTKVVPRGAADGLFINTSGIGVIPAAVDLGTHRLKAGCRLLVSGPVGDHGAAILACRRELALGGDLISDCASLWPLVKGMLEEPGLLAMRDATRGGVNAVLHEFAAAAGLSVELEEAAIPVRPAVRGLCELLGLDPLQLACEGRLLAAVEADAAERMLERMHAHPLGSGAQLIGRLVPQRNSAVIVRGLYGVERSLPAVSGELLPRIC
ncbi:hydrogenase expression/formation protein HypE [Marinobacterium nitratireducens]|uniref:Hydrogenase expression/formation protein HypE n=1 Tax=Marinobacterium nitratireducens TaxID=518897 RepID=A0A917ZNB5_9GAMM|nr:hydrogenase expression/formation protein HypE [Marinobacterium nitratireducens]GGO86907.1 hydrogenase expression/formation protein HypE [Marinobacterium nitratireducens]